MRSHAINLVRSAFRRGPLEHLLLRATAGRPYAGLRAKLTPLHTSYPAPTVRTAVRYGCRLRLDLSDLTDWYVYWGFTDPSHDAIVSRCRPGATVLDVGANRGITALRIARAVGAGGRLIALEPEPGSHALLRERLDANGLSWVTPLRRAASDRAGVVHITARDERNTGMNQVAASGAEAEASTIDALVAELGFERLDVIKIDVEGFETRVLRGASGALERWRPEIVFEVADANLRAFGSSRDELIGLVRERGYRVLDAVTGAPPGEQLHFDALALPDRPGGESAAGEVRPISPVPRADA